MVIVDIYSRHVAIFGMEELTCDAVLHIWTMYKATYIPNPVSQQPTIHGYPLTTVQTDAGPQFTSVEFRAQAAKVGFALRVAAPQHQEQNGICENMIRDCKELAFSFLHQARVSMSFFGAALLTAAYVKNVLPLRNITDINGKPTTAYTLFYSRKPSIRKLRVPFCPCVFRINRRSKTYFATDSSGRIVERFDRKNFPQRGVPGIFIGYPRSQAGYLIWIPTTGKTVVSADVSFDEEFRQSGPRRHFAFRDALPIQRDEDVTENVDPDNFVNTDRTQDDYGVPQQEYWDGNSDEPSSGFPIDNSDLPPASGEENQTDTEPADSPPDDDEEEVSGETYQDPDRQPDPARIPRFSSSGRLIKQRRGAEYIYNTCHSSETFQVNQMDMSSVDVEVDAVDGIQHTYEAEEPELVAPVRFRDILRMPPRQRELWTKAFKAEFKMIVFEMNAVEKENGRYHGQRILNFTQVYNIKYKANGEVDKVKVRFPIQGFGNVEAKQEDNGSPLARFRTFLLFCSEASRRRRRIFQLDLVSAYLHADMDREVFVKFPQAWSELIPEYSDWLGVPLLMVKAIYGHPSCGKLLADMLIKWLEEFGFVQSDVDPAVLYFYREQMFLLTYCDDMGYFGSDDEIRREFEEGISTDFKCKLLGQMHWFLNARVTQHANFDTTVDQARYAASIIQRYLPNAETIKISDADKRKYGAPLPSEFEFTKEDNSESVADVKQLESEFGFEFRAVVGSLLWLTNTVGRIQFAVKRFSKVLNSPGRNHFQALLHCLHHLRTHRLTGITMFANVLDAPISKMLFEYQVDPSSPVVVFSDSSWQDVKDDGRSTGCFAIFVQGALVQISSFIPNPVAMSSAEAESNAFSTAGMAMMSIKMLVLEMRGRDPDEAIRCPMIVDNTACKAINESFRDTKHTRHLLRRWLYGRWLCEIQDGDELPQAYICWIPTDMMIADIGTKNLPALAPTQLLYGAVCETAVHL